MAEEVRIVVDIDRILADLETCTQAMETMRPIVSDGTLLKKFDRNYSANVVICLQDILRDHAIMTLCRMWDTDKDTQSIPSVMCSLPSKDSNKASHQKHDQVVRVVNMMSKSARLKQLRNWRDKYLGHALKTTRLEKSKGTNIVDPIWDDIFVLYRRTGVVVEALTAVAADCSIDHIENRGYRARDAEAFWGSFINQPK